ncbi:MAG TPA: YdcF family protein [Candidatus Acidoferrales bacterium]|nr:YdcF family protein [Candidatus Acidoferrales bacterium]
MRRIGVWALFVVTVAAALAYAARRPLLTAVGDFLIVQDAPQPADAIVVLSGSLPDRILEAVDLYQAHLAPRIVLTREEPLPGIDALRARGGVLQEHHEQNVSAAVQLGVPANALSVMPTPSSSTFAEVQALTRYLRDLKVRSILLVTSKAHARRAAIIFRHVAGDAVQISVCPSRYDPFAADSWWQNRAFARRVVIEYGKLLTYLLVDRWRPLRFTS